MSLFSRRFLKNISFEESVTDSCIGCCIVLNLIDNLAVLLVGCQS